MVSFIIPVYNGEAFIERCIRSIIDNTVPESGFEIIVIDDGSQDGTRVIVDKLGEIYSFIKVVHQKNKGVSAARKSGIQNATGEWIVFVDADDFVTADMIEIISAQSEKDCDWIIFSGAFLETQFIDLDICSNRNSIIVAILNQSKEKGLLNAHFNTVWSKAYRREIIINNKIEFEQTLSHGEDMLFNIDYVKKCKTVYCISCSVYTLYSHENSATHKYQKNCIINDKAFFKLLDHRNLDKYGNLIREAYYRMALNGIWICLGQYFTHPLNKMKLKNKKEELALFLNQEPYKTGLKYYKYERKEVRKLVLMLLHFHFYSIVLLGVKFFRNTNRVEDIGSTAI